MNLFDVLHILVKCSAVGEEPGKRERETALSNNEIQSLFFLRVSEADHFNVHALKY